MSIRLNDHVTPGDLGLEFDLGTSESGGKIACPIGADSRGRQVVIAHDTGGSLILEAISIDAAYQLAGEIEYAADVASMFSLQAAADADMDVASELEGDD